MKDQYNHKYDDIINLPHPTSKKHPRMSLYARAAQFSPFAALTGRQPPGPAGINFGPPVLYVLSLPVPAGDLKSVQPWSFPRPSSFASSAGWKDQQHHCKSSLHHPVHFQIRAHLL